MKEKKIFDFYKETSCYTALGFYENFAKNLPDDIKELCILQRMQTIHPAVFKNKEIRNSENCFWGNMRKISEMVLWREDDLFPTALSMLAEILRKNPNYSKNREAKDKLFVTCRGQAILLASILKAKGIPARVRSGFAEYPSNNGIYWDHWVTEYYNADNDKWTLIDADCCCNDNIDFDIYDISDNKFLTAPQVWVAFRENNLGEIKIGHAYYGTTKLIEMLTTALFYDFHCLMNNELIYVHFPKYLRDKNFELDEIDLKEIDDLAKLMLDPNSNFDALREIWHNNSRFRIVSGGTVN